MQGAFDKAVRENDTALNGLLRDLKQLGPEGAAASDAMKEHFRNAGKAGHRSMDEVLDQIRKIDPEAAAAADAAATELKDAATDSERQYRDVVEELESMGDRCRGRGCYAPTPERRRAAHQESRPAGGWHINTRVRRTWPISRSVNWRWCRWNAV